MSLLGSWLAAQWKCQLHPALLWLPYLPVPFHTLSLCLFPYGSCFSVYLVASAASPRLLYYDVCGEISPRPPDLSGDMTLGSWCHFLAAAVFCEHGFGSALALPSPALSSFVEARPGETQTLSS